jgi:hypothetical protein
MENGPLASLDRCKARSCTSSDDFTYAQTYLITYDKKVVYVKSIFVLVEVNICSSMSGVYFGPTSDVKTRFKRVSSKCSNCAL